MNIFESSLCQIIHYISVVRMTIEKIATLEDGETWKETEYDLQKNLIYEYDFIQERIEYWQSGE